VKLAPEVTASCGGPQIGDCSAARGFPSFAGFGRLLSSDLRATVLVPQTAQAAAFGDPAADCFVPICDGKRQVESRLPFRMKRCDEYNGRGNAAGE
jgi:hypothetical protein